MARLANITKFPHAHGEGGFPRRGTPRAVVHELAFLAAVENFQVKYGREPDYDILYFRGGHVTTGAVCEIWEEE